MSMVTNVGPANVGPANVGPANIGPTNIGPTNIGPTNIGPMNIGPMRVGPMSIDLLVLKTSPPKVVIAALLATILIVAVPLALVLAYYIGSMAFQTPRGFYPVSLIAERTMAFIRGAGSARPFILFTVLYGGCIGLVHWLCSKRGWTIVVPEPVTGMPLRYSGTLVVSSVAGPIAFGLFIAAVAPQFASLACILVPFSGFAFYLFWHEPFAWIIARMNGWRGKIAYFELR